MLKNKQIKTIILTIIVALSFISCGSSSNNSNNENTTITGTFVDDPVEGLTYSCSSGTSGTTNANGEYNCPNGDDVTFSLGSVVLGTLKAQEDMITPYSLFPNNATAALNLARLLQSIGDTANGTLSLNMELVEQLTSNIDFRSENFEEEIQTLLDITLVSASQARETLNESISSRGGEVPLVGIDGQDGEDGEQGIQGEQGEQGEQGPAGEDGIDGEDGEQGPAGQDGADGVDGQDGVQGTQGEDGEDGANGEQGEQGVQGDVGVDGQFSLMQFSEIASGDADCPFGGVLLESGVDDGDGILTPAEVQSSEKLCNDKNNLDRTSPTITAYSPSGGSASIKNHTLDITFSESMDTGSLSRCSILLDDTSGYIDGLLNYSDVQKKLTFSPFNQLQEDVDYTMRVTTQVQDSSGNNLANEHTHSFILKRLYDQERIDGPKSSSVAISDDGDTVIIGEEFGENDGNGQLSGTAYIYVRDGDNWILQQKISDPTGINDGAGNLDVFGKYVALSSDGNTAIIGAPYSNDRKGSVYIFIRSGAVWSQQDKFTHNGAVQFDYFGTQISISDDGNTSVIGTSINKAFVYIRSGVNWTLQQELNGDGVGSDVAIASDGNIVIVGGNDKAVVYTRSGIIWSKQQVLNTNGTTKVAISGDGITVIAASNERADVYVENTATWSLQQQLSPSDATNEFGFDIALSEDGNNVIIGARNDQTVEQTNGAVYIFKRNNLVWTESRKIYAYDVSSQEYFGESVSLSADGYTAIVSTINFSSKTYILE